LKPAIDTCPCGLPLHYENRREQAMVEALIDKFGEAMAVRTTTGSWLVSRHFAALHGIDASTLAAEAARYGFAQIDVVEMP